MSFNTRVPLGAPGDLNQSSTGLCKDSACDVPVVVGDVTAAASPLFRTTTPSIGTYMD
jgi:hypothetical protein